MVMFVDGYYGIDDIVLCYFENEVWVSGLLKGCVLVLLVELVDCFGLVFVRVCEVVWD